MPLFIAVVARSSLLVCGSSFAIRVSTEGALEFLDFGLERLDWVLLLGAKSDPLFVLQERLILHCQLINYLLPVIGALISINVINDSKGFQLEMLGCRILICVGNEQVQVARSGSGSDNSTSNLGYLVGMCDYIISRFFRELEFAKFVF